MPKLKMTAERVQKINKLKSREKRTFYSVIQNFPSTKFYLAYKVATNSVLS